jgi:hypothetical protein
MHKIPAMLLLLALAACSTQEKPNTAARPATPGTAGATVPLTDADRAAVETAVRARLANDAATFRSMIGQRDQGGTVTVCGYVNPGSGDTPFVGQLSAGAFTVADLGGPAERTIAVQQACHGRGIYI